MERTLFHGSEKIIKRPAFGLGKPYNDYGRGFYCTEAASMAREWAVGIDHDGFANEYRLDDEGLAVLDLDGPGFTLLHWLSVLLCNRYFDVRTPLAAEARDYIVGHFPVDTADADIIEGYRADDSYFAFAQDFIGGAISYRQLGNAMRLGALGRQVVVKSERAFERLEFVRAEEVSRQAWFPRKELRDREARRRYFDKERNARRKGDLFITTIMDEGMEAGDERLR